MTETPRRPLSCLSIMAAAVARAAGAPGDGSAAPTVGGSAGHRRPGG